MATNAQFVTTPNKGTPVSLITADSSLDGTGANVALVFTAGTSGSFLAYLTCKPLGTNIASLLRVFKNNGGTVGTAANNALIREIATPSSTASSTAAMPELNVMLNITLAAGERIYVSLGTTVASGWRISPMNGGDY